MPVSIGVKMNAAKGMFFDAKAVIDATEKAERRNLSKAGAYIRRTAQFSIRKRRKVSDVGRPPSSHTGLLRKGILFAYDARQSSVIIGPVDLNKRGDAPQLLEEGGTTTIVDGGRRRRAVYRPRPYMGPALAENLPKLPELWANSIK